MKYFNARRKQMLPNKKLDAFLIELNFLCKKHKIALNGLKGSPLSAEIYSTTTAKSMLHNIQDNLTDIKEQKKKKDFDGNLDTEG